jgi:hypothetical protein
VIRGEATASYAADTSSKIIDEILVLNPGIKIILMIRNPVLRAWSHLKMDLFNKSTINSEERSLEDIPASEVCEYLASPYQLACADYETMIRKWESRVQDNLFIGFFDDIHLRPLALLQQVAEFLRISTRGDPFRLNIGRVFSPTDKNAQRRVMPQSYSKFLEDMLGPNLSWLKAKFGRNFEF